jgi:hypothetical protein
MVGAVAYPERSLHLVPDGSIQIRWNLHWLKPSCTCPLLPVGVTSLLVPNLLLFRTVPVLSAKAWPDNQNKHCESHSRCSNTAEFLVPDLRSQSHQTRPHSIHREDTTCLSYHILNYCSAKGTHRDIAHGLRLHEAIMEFMRVKQEPDDPDARVTTLAPRRATRVPASTPRIKQEPQGMQLVR